MKTFVPYRNIGDKKTIIVDGLHPHNFTLSHWKGANNNVLIRADTSAEIVLNALQNQVEECNLKYVSATHFDIDGFVGVFALFYPELALKNKKILVAMANIGDFREFEPNNENHLTALKLCCWINKIEKEQFYRPFELKEEIESCVEKFDFFLKNFNHVLLNIDNYRRDWEDEYHQVLEGVQQIKYREEHPEYNLLIHYVEQPIHYYALFHTSYLFDWVLSIYSDNRYELEMKYRTWVDTTSRPSYPRISFKGLANHLNWMEKSNYCWIADSITDTGPILRLENEGITKADRYDQPFHRPIYSSSLTPDQFKETVIRYLKVQLSHIEPKCFWTWKEMRALNSNTNQL